MMLTNHERRALAAMELALIKDDPLFAIRCAKLTPKIQQTRSRRRGWLRRLFRRHRPAGPGMP